MKHLHHIIAIAIFMLLLAACGRKGGNDAVYADGLSVVEMRDRGMAALNRSEADVAIKIGTALLDPAKYDQTANGSAAAIYGRIILGQGMMLAGDVQKTYSYLHEAEKMCRTAHNDSALASVYNGLGVYFLNTEDDYAQSLKCMFAGIEAAKRSKNERLHSILLANVGVTYQMYNDPNALRYGMECYYRGKKLNDGKLQYMGAITAAKALARNKEYTQAQKLLEEAETLMHANGMHDEPALFTTFGIMYWDKGDYDKARGYFEEAIANIRGINVEYNPYIYLANIHSKQGNYAKAEKLLRTAYAKSVNSKDHFYRKDIVNNLTILLERQGRGAEAAKLRESEAAVESEVNNDEKSQTIVSLRHRYDIERAENEILRREGEVREKKVLLWVLTGVLLVIAACGTGILVMYRRKSRLYEAIVRQASESARQEGILRTALREIEEKYVPEVVPLPEAADPTASPASPPTPAADAEDGADEPDDAADDEAGADADRFLIELQARFEALMADPAVYADKEVSKEKVARLLGTNRTYVSRMVNRIYGVNFPAYVNSLRIKEAIRVLSDPMNDTPLKTLADDIGYSSMTTFYAKFKEETGMTPASFRQKAKSMNS